MNKNWKKRLVHTITDIEAYIISIMNGTIAMLGTTILSVIIFGHGKTLIPAIAWGITSFSSFGYFVYKALFAKTHESDNAIDKQKKQKKVEEDMKQRLLEKAQETEKKIKQMEHLLNLVKESVRASDRTMMLTVGEIVQIIRDILEKEGITIEEEHYVTYTLPRDIAEMMRLYRELDDERKQQKQQEILLFLQHVQKDLQEHFIERHQNETMKALDKRLLLSKQRMYERE